MYSRRQILEAGAAMGVAAFSRPSLLSSHEASPGMNGGCMLCRSLASARSKTSAPVLPRSLPPQLLLAARGSRSSTSNAAVRAHERGRAVVLQPTWVLVPDGDRLNVLLDHDVIVQGDLIEMVRPRQPTRDERFDAAGQILLPGFISGHTHSAAGTMTRGFIEQNSFAAVQTDDPSLPGRSLLRPMVLMEDLSDEELDDLTAINLAEIVRSGCTTQVEMSLSLKQMKSYVRTAARFGIRGYPSGMVPGMKRLLAIWGRDDDKILRDSVPETLVEIEANLVYARSIAGSESGRIRPMLGPSVTSVHTRETFAAIKQAATELRNGVHIHIQNGWDPKDSASVQRVWNKQEIGVLEEVGLLDAPLFGAHLLGIDLARDLPVLARRRFTFAYCPSAAGASAIPSSEPYAEALAAGVNTCIGLDTHSNDYLENIKLGVMQGRARAQLLGKSSPVRTIEPTIWNALRSASMAGAIGLGRMDLGRIEAGAKADLCTVDVSGPLVGNGTQPREPYNNLLYANGLSVRNVMTDGNWQVRDGRFILDDEAKIVARGGAVVRKVWTQLEKEGFFVPMPR
jgi:cytosine/adenosine deaminase-related metal-dependent hydrolase